MPKTTARAKLLKAALDLMLRKGYAATRVDEICGAAGVSKGSFYHFFNSKEELGLAVIDEYLRRVEKRVAAGSFTALEDPRERALAFIDHLVDVAEEAWGPGCLIGSFAIDIVDTSPAIRSAVSEQFSRLVDAYAEAFAPAVDHQGPDAARQLAEQFLVTVEGAIVLAKAHGDWSHARRALERFRAEAQRQAGVAV